MKNKNYITEKDRVRMSLWTDGLTEWKIEALLTIWSAPRYAHENLKN